MPKLQLTLPGRRTDDGTDQAAIDTIKIDLDNPDGKFGKAISLSLYKEMVNRYSTQPDLREDEKIFFTIDKQLLHILLASTKCNSLGLCKCIKRNGEESIAFVALDKDGHILGTKVNPATNVVEQADADSDISGGEWIHGLTRRDAIENKIIAENPLVDNFFNFGEYLSSLKNQAEKLNPDL